MITKSPVFQSFEKRIADKVSANIAHNERAYAKARMYGSIPSRGELLTEDAEKVKAQMLRRMTKSHTSPRTAQIKRAAAKQRNRSKRTSTNHLYR